MTGPNADYVDSVYESGYQGWLDIPGYDGGRPLPYPGYLHSIDFNIVGEEQEFCEFPYLSGGIVFVNCGWYELADVNISLYVIMDSEGALYSMMAWASDSDGDGYEVPVHYSAGGGSFTTLR